jgi:hypothetical protein
VAALTSLNEVTPRRIGKTIRFVAQFGFTKSGGRLRMVSGREHQAPVTAYQKNPVAADKRANG